MNEIRMFAAALMVFTLTGTEASDKRNLYMMRDTSNGGSFHFKLEEKLKGKIRIDDRTDQMEDRPRFSFWVDSSDMMKIPRNADDQRWPWFEISNAEEIRKKVEKKASKSNLECAAIEADIEIKEYNYAGVQRTEAADAAAIKLKRLGKIESGKCDPDLQWWTEIVKKKDSHPFKR